MGAFLYFIQDKLIYLPPAQDFENCPMLASAERVTHQGTRFYYKELPDSKTRIVMYHGNASSACDLGFLASEFEKENVSYIFPEYAGYANDSGSPSGELLLRDVQNMDSFIQTLPMKKLIVAGESIGTGFASYHTFIDQPDKVLLISPFTSLSKLAEKSYPLFPVELMLKTDLKNIEWLKNYSGSVLIIHGTADRVVPYEMGTRLFESLKTADKEKITIPGADHNELYGHTETMETISKFIRE